ncbi:MAG: transporter [Bacteroidota bacterium]
MKKIIITIFIMTIAFTTKACDICGCGVGNGYIGILPEFYKHIFGVRYRFNSLYTHLGVNGSSTYLTTREKYSVTELWGAWSFKNKYRVLLSLPYNFSEKSSLTTASEKNGIGDITVNGYYQLLYKKNTLRKNRLLVQSLWVGGGIKLPTGEYNPSDKSSTGSQNTNLFQLGTGSVDYLLAAMYDIRLQDAGLNASATYKFNGNNKYDYTYGNKFTLTTQFYYKFKFKKVGIAPNTGLQFEKAQKDIDNHFAVDLSGGQLLLGGVGAEASYKKIAMGINWQTPLSQNLASGFVKANNRMMLHVAYVF